MGILIFARAVVSFHQLAFLEVFQQEVLEIISPTQPYLFFFFFNLNNIKNINNILMRIIKQVLCERERELSVVSFSFQN